MPAPVALLLGLSAEFLFFFLVVGSAFFYAFVVWTGRRRQVPLPWKAGDPYPTILLHGYSQNAGNWFWFGRLLRRAGVNSLSHLSLTPMFASIERHAERLERHVERLCAETGAPRVNIVAHSMGGLVSRWYIQVRGGGPRVALLVTFGTPHRGTIMAWAGLGASAREMRPGSPLLARLAGDLSGLADTRVLSYWSNLDQLVIPSRSGALGAPGTDRFVPWFGHSAFLFSRRLAREVAAAVVEPAEATAAAATGTPPATPPQTSLQR